jgi:hypothetical protein
MKKLVPQVAVALALMAVASTAAFAQTSSTTMMTTTTGTVNAWKPNAVAVKVDTSSTPVSYSFTKTTTYVDQNGNPVSIETVRSGVPVTVYYHNLGGNYVADKVVIHRTLVTTTTAPAETTVTTVPPPTQTTTTTTETPAIAPPTVNGVVTDAGDGHIDLRTSQSPRPIHYRAHDSTAYVDESGNPVSRKQITEGTPVTIFYEQSGDDLFATRVVVRNPAVLDR